jgi:ribosome-associated heat shock protein Hsp15
MSGAAPVVTQAGAALRLDKWLWFARFARTRSLAAKLCESGLVRLGGEAVAKANRAVRIGDVLAIPQGRVVRTVQVRALGARRGAAAEARLLYDEVAEPRPRDPGPGEDWTPLLGDPE